MPEPRPGSVQAMPRAQGTRGPGSPLRPRDNVTAVQTHRLFSNRLCREVQVHSQRERKAQGMPTSPLLFPHSGSLLSTPLTPEGDICYPQRAHMVTSLSPRVCR